MAGLITGRLCALGILVTLQGALATRTATSLGSNPIRRAVTLLQKMQKKVADEGESDKVLYEKFECYCSSSAKTLEVSISEAEAKLPLVKSSLDESSAQFSQLEKDLDGHQQDRTECKQTLAKAKSLREKEATAFVKESSDAKANILALGKGIAALESGTGSFLQMPEADTVKRLTVSMDLGYVDRDMLASFLSQQEGYVPQSGQIIGILRQMKDTMEKDLAELIAQEEKAKAEYAGLTAAKEQEVKTCTKAIEAKLARKGKTGVAIETLKEDLEDTNKSLKQDKKFLMDLDTTCDKKKAEWDLVQKTRAEELLALSKAISILNEDEALELFKKTLPSPSFLQTGVTLHEVRQLTRRALATGRAPGRRDDADLRLDFLALALRGRKVSFEKIIPMIDNMVALLGREQESDNSKKTYCEAELDKNEDAVKELTLDISDLRKSIEETQSSMDALSEEIASLVRGIKELDMQVAQATTDRQSENAHSREELASDQAAKEVLAEAINILNAFYNPALYKPPPEVERSREDEIFLKFGGAVPESFIQVSEQVAPPPEAFGAYVKKGQESSGVLELLKMLIADLDKEMQEIQVEEKNAQAEYEQLIADAVSKRSADSEAIEEKEYAKAELEAQAQLMKGERKSKTREALATTNTIRDLHTECDFLLLNFDARKEARADEVEALKNAKAILSGADYSLVQTGLVHMHES